MTASRDHDLRRYALDLGYEEQGRSGAGLHEFVHTKTGEVVRLPDSASDYHALQDLLADLRRGAAVSNRGRRAVVNARKTKKAKRGTNSARLEMQRLARLRQEYETRAEERARANAAIPPAPAPTRIPSAVIQRWAELRDLEGLMRGV